MQFTKNAMFAEEFAQFNTPVTVTISDPDMMMKNCSVSMYITAASPPIAEQM